MNKLLKKLSLVAFALLFANSVNAAENLNLSNKILFVEKEKTGTTFLSVMDSDGANKKRLTPSLFNIILPKYNPQKGWVAFTNQTENMVSEVYILNETGDKLQKILTKASFEDFSPDGKSFIYTTTDQNAALYVYNIEKKEATKISQNLKVVSANWSPDGEWIVASAMTEDGSLDLYLISCYAQGIIRATETPKVNEAFPMFSNDNLKVAFFTNRHGPKNEIEILGVGVKNNLALSRPMLVGTHPSFSPDDKYIVYQDGDNIFVSDIKGLEPKKIGTGRTPYWVK